MEVRPWIDQGPMVVIDTTIVAKREGFQATMTIRTLTMPTRTIKLTSINPMVR